MGNKKDSRLEAVKYDLDLYFYLKSDEETWNLRVEDHYLDMNKVSWNEFTQVLTEYCKERGLRIAVISEGLDGISRTFEIIEIDQAHLLTETAK